MLAIGGDIGLCINPADEGPRVRVRFPPPASPVRHVVFTLPSAIGDIAYHNKAVIYDLLFTTSAETMLTSGPRVLGLSRSIRFVIVSCASHLA